MFNEGDAMKHEDQQFDDRVINFSHNAVDYLCHLGWLTGGFLGEMVGLLLAVPVALVCTVILFFHWFSRRLWRRLVKGVWS